MLNFLKSGGIRESYFFNRLEALLNAQILKFWLFPHCPHQAQSRYKKLYLDYYFLRIKFILVSKKIKIQQKQGFCKDCTLPAVVRFVVEGIIGVIEIHPIL